MADTATLTHGEVSVEQLKEKARLLRKHIIEMTTEAGSGHPSSSFSCTENLSGPISALWVSLV